MGGYIDKAIENAAALNAAKPRLNPINCDPLKIIERIIGECESEMSHAKHRKKVASMDNHRSEEEHQEGRWHCANDISEFLAKLKQEIALQTPEGHALVSLRSLKHWLELVDLNPQDLRPRIKAIITLWDAAGTENNT